MKHIEHVLTVKARQCIESLERGALRDMAVINQAAGEAAKGAAAHHPGDFPQLPRGRAPESQGM